MTNNFYEVKVDYKAESSLFSEAKNLNFGRTVYHTVAKTKTEVGKNLKPIIDAHKKHLNRWNDLKGLEAELDICKIGTVSS